MTQCAQTLLVSMHARLCHEAKVVWRSCVMAGLVVDCALAPCKYTAEVEVDAIQARLQPTNPTAPATGPLARLSVPPQSLEAPVLTCLHSAGATDASDNRMSPDCVPPGPFPLLPPCSRNLLFRETLSSICMQLRAGPQRAAPQIDSFRQRLGRVGVPCADREYMRQTTEMRGSASHCTTCVLSRDESG